jgi:putative PIN family toxin of toxin-antitoxin system
MLRAVLDTSVLVAAFRSRLGASYLVLGAAAEGRILPLISVPLFVEYESVLLRPEQMAAHGLSKETVITTLMGLAAVSEPVDIQFRWRPQLRDANDEMVLEAAINGSAAAIITHNAADFEGAAGRFGIQVMRPRKLLKGILQ